jgi:hypothetical protein
MADDELGKIGEYDHKYGAPASSFSKIGALQAISGDIKLVGRDGERDHLFSPETSIDKYYMASDKVVRMHKMSDPGWMTYQEIANDLKARIFEALDQRRSLDRPISEKALMFEQRHRDTGPVTISMMERKK